MPDRFSSIVPSEDGTEVNLGKGNDKHQAKVVEYESRVVIYYDRFFETGKANSEKLQQLNAVLAQAGLQNTDKEIQYKAL